MPPPRLFHSIALVLFLICGPTTRSTVEQLASASGVYDSSHTPLTLPWNTYNFCNAPHVNTAHYELPSSITSNGGHLVHVSVIMRHHKRTPDNLAPSERVLNPTGWICSDATQLTYDLGGTAIAHDATTPLNHPFASTIWSGTCDAGQLTPGGLLDASQHGKDLWELYHDRLGFLSAVDPAEIWVRTSTEDRTMQVAGAMLAAMDPSVAGQPWTVYTQPASIDSLVPAYPCPAANAVRARFQAVPAWTDHLRANAALKARLDAVFGTAGLDAWASWYDHFFDALSARTCHGHPLPCNAAGTCVSEADAASVFAIGDFEYDYIWNAARNASTYNSLTFGAFFAELADALAEPTHRLALHIGHDGTLVRLLAGLGAVPLRWPSFGSEIVFEIWEVQETRFIRVFHEGTVLAGMEWIHLDDFIQKLRALVPDQLFEQCMRT
ncbi:phosphoglycerate mutase-like protein [Russula earlei]|uniref:Phosphoglycerate mutase-like protein n=1 Tax=Russula earlei TaxID=71964 RepID=A0ACC0U5X1_9AGAM|nr:phosphoglycerate mutase-like protein [Russula earlei]